MLREVDKARWLLHLWTSLSANRWVVLAALLLSVYFAGPFCSSVWSGCASFLYGFWNATWRCAHIPTLQLFGWLPNVLLPHMLAIGWFKFHPRVS